MLIKRLLDFVAASAGLVLLSPFFLLIAVCIKFDSRGPVFFRQERVGLCGRPFWIHKFRTMRHGDTISGSDVTVGDDIRITRIGRFLRKHKLDELPQLIDVVRGEMSLVGPRPEVPKYVNHYSDQDKSLVLSVLPGITDLASIRYHNESELLAAHGDPEATYIHAVLPRKLRYYRFYVRHRSLLLDFRLIVMTLCALAGCKHRR